MRYKTVNIILLISNEEYKNYKLSQKLIENKIILNNFVFRTFFISS